MADPRIHPEPREDRSAESERAATQGTRGRLPIGSILLIVLALVVVVLMVVLHLTGTIGPGSH